MGEWWTRALRLFTPLLSAVLVGIWINWVTDRTSGGDVLTAIHGLGWSNLVLIGGVAALVTGDMTAWRLGKVQTVDFRRRYELLKVRQRRILESTLEIVCSLVSATLQVPCNARYFIAETDAEGRTYLRQDRDLAVLNIQMPREFGFTRIYVDTPHIVIGRAYRDRVPVFEELAADHSTRYDPEVERMIEPAQRWVLACPVLRLDIETNQHDPEHPPHGVIVFYGTELPAATGDGRVEMAMRHSQTFAEQMSHVLNMLELTTPNEAIDGRAHQEVP